MAVCCKCCLPYKQVDNFPLECFSIWKWQFVSNGTFSEQMSHSIELYFKSYSDRKCFQFSASERQSTVATFLDMLAVSREENFHSTVNSYEGLHIKAYEVEERDIKLYFLQEFWNLTSKSCFRPDFIWSWSCSPAWPLSTFFWCSYYIC